MGIKMMVEILDHWQDAGLTAGERNDLLVLAENANDGTRLTFGPVHEPYILRRAGKTAAGWKNAIGKLAAKKVLAVHAPGRIKQAAVYRLVPLCPEGRHDGHKGQCVRRERVTPEVTQSEKEGHLSDDPMGHPTGDPLAQEGHLSDAERVTSQVTPTPLVPSFKISSNTSSSPAGLVETEPPSVPEVTDGGGGGDSDLRSIAAHITASLDYQGQMPDKQQQERITAALVAALEAGWTMKGLAVYLHLGSFRPDNPAAFYLAKLTTKLPPAVPAPVPAPTAAGVRGRVLTGAEVEALTEDDVFGPSRPTAARSWAEESANAAARLAAGPLPGTDTTVAGRGAVARQLRTEHKPYSNGDWHRPADPFEALKIPHCGHQDCDPHTRLRPGAAPQDDPEPCEKCHPALAWPPRV